LSIVGTVLRSHAGGYLVHVESLKVAPSESDTGAKSAEPSTFDELILFCQARGRLKKEKVAIVTGDRVELDEVVLPEKTAVIVSQLERRSLISRPPLANVDQVVIVQAVKQPDWSPLWTDRYLVHFQLAMPFQLPILCFNKCDLVDKIELNRLRSIYEPLGYFVIFVSAKTGEGLPELAARLFGKTSMFAGPSGVGKSSLLNVLCPGLNLKVGLMENDFGVGRHTTTYSELYRMSWGEDGALVPGSDSCDRQSWIADTPGFNLIELLHPEPRDVAKQFFEIETLGQQCRFANCLHLVEAGCAVLALLRSVMGDEESQAESEEAAKEAAKEAAEVELDDETQEAAPSNQVLQLDEERDSVVADVSGDVLHLSRYQSYVVMVAESQEKQAAAKVTSRKVESAVKSIGGTESGSARTVPRLANRYRTSSRRKEKQKLRSVAEVEDEVEDVKDPWSHLAADSSAD
jgi:ribosome biogenesis GTPase